MDSSEGQEKDRAMSGSQISIAKIDHEYMVLWKPQRTSNTLKDTT